MGSYKTIHDFAFPFYYKSGTRYTVIMKDFFYVQIEKLHETVNISVGRSQMIADKCLNNDVVCTEDEFADFFNEQASVFQNYVSLLSIAMGNSDN